MRRRPRKFQLAFELRGQGSIASESLADHALLKKVGRETAASITICREPVSSPANVPLTARPSAKVAEQRCAAIPFDTRTEGTLA